MNTRLRKYFTVIGVLVGGLILLIIGIIAFSPQWPKVLSWALNSPLPTPVTTISRDRAILVAQKDAHSYPHLDAISQLDVVSADLMHYDDAKRRSGQNTSEYINLPDDLDVWFVVLTGTWQLIPPPCPTPCPSPIPWVVQRFFIVSARDGYLIVDGGYSTSTPTPSATATPMPPAS